MQKQVISKYLWIKDLVVLIERQREQSAPAWAIKIRRSQHLVCYTVACYKHFGVGRQS